MEEFYFSTSVSNDITLCISPLTDERAAAAGILDDAIGYFLYERRMSGSEHDIAVIARIQSEDAAFRLSQILGME